MRKVIKEIPGYELHDEVNSPAGHHTKQGWRSDAIRSGPFIFVGALGTRPHTHMLGETVEEEVRIIFEHFKTALEVHGSTMEDIVQLTMYFTHRERDWPILERIRREYFPKDPPISVGVGVADLANGGAVEISAIAVAPD